MGNSCRKGEQPDESRRVVVNTNVGSHRLGFSPLIGILEPGARCRVRMQHPIVSEWLNVRAAGLQCIQPMERSRSSAQ